MNNRNKNVCEDLENVLKMDGEKFWKVIKRISEDYDEYDDLYFAAHSENIIFAKHVIRGVLGEIGGTD